MLVKRSRASAMTVTLWLEPISPMKDKWAIMLSCLMARKLGMATVTADVIPYGSVRGNAAYLAGLNVVGLKRRGFSREKIKDLRAAYRLLFAPEGTFAERLDDVSRTYAKHELVMDIIKFIRAQKVRALCMPNAGT